MKDSCLTKWSGDYIAPSQDMMDRAYNSWKLDAEPVSHYWPGHHITLSLAFVSDLHSSLENVDSQSTDF